MPAPAWARGVGRGPRPSRRATMPGWSSPCWPPTARSCFGLCCVLLPFSRGVRLRRRQAGRDAVPPPRRRRPVPHPRDPARGRLARVHGLRLLRRRPAGLAGDLRRGLVARARQPRRDGRRALGDAPAARDARPPDARSQRRSAGRRPRRPLLAEIVAWSTGHPSELLALDVDELHGRGGRRAGRGQRPASARRTTGRTSPARDLAGQDLRGRDLRGARPARRAADRAPTCAAPTSATPTCWAPTCATPTCAAPTWRRALFLTQPQVNAMRGDAPRRSPPTWPAPPTGADRALGGTPSRRPGTSGTA